VTTHAKQVAGAASPAPLNEGAKEVCTDPASRALVGSDRPWEIAQVAWWREAANVIVECARVEPGMTVLDLVGGDGELTLILAREVGPLGHVMAIAPDPGLLAFVAERTRRPRSVRRLHGQLGLRLRARGRRLERPRDDVVLDEDVRQDAAEHDPDRGEEDGAIHPGDEGARPPRGSGR